MTLFLVRHGLPLIDPGRPANEWPLDPAGFEAIDAFRASGSLPRDARWFSSPEPKALGTARRLTDALPGEVDVTVVAGLREHERGVTPWYDDLEAWRALVRRMFEVPEASAHEGWEPLADTRERVVSAVRRILGDHPGEDLVLTGHGTAWTLLVAELTGAPPDLDAWAALRMPDLWVVETHPASE